LCNDRKECAMSDVPERPGDPVPAAPPAPGKTEPVPPEMPPAGAPQPEDVPPQPPHPTGPPGSVAYSFTAPVSDDT
jgi:hypothetical protein